MSNKLLKKGTKVRIHNGLPATDSTGVYITSQMHRKEGNILVLDGYAGHTGTNRDGKEIPRYNIIGDIHVWTTEMFTVVVIKNVIGGELL